MLLFENERSSDKKAPLVAFMPVAQLAMLPSTKSCPTLELVRI